MDKGLLFIQGKRAAHKPGKQCVIQTINKLVKKEEEVILVLRRAYTETVSVLLTNQILHQGCLKELHRSQK